MDDVDKSVIQDLWATFRREYDCSVDRMVCDPILRTEFVDAARAVCGCGDEFAILWTAMNLRKAKKLRPEKHRMVPSSKRNRPVKRDLSDRRSEIRGRGPTASIKETGDNEDR